MKIEDFGRIPAPAEGQELIYAEKAAAVDNGGLVILLIVPKA